GENASTEVAQDLWYDLTLTQGRAHTPFYSKAGLLQNAFTRWIKKTTLNPLPSTSADKPIQLNMNTAYLVFTKFLANYDLNLHVSETTIANTYDQWMNNTLKD